MKKPGFFIIIIVGFTLAGCRSESDSGGSSSHDPHYYPRLDAFHLVDSYGNSTEDDIDPFLVLDPFIDSGLFEFYWYADNLHDYTIEFRINDAPRLGGSRLISSDYCGIDLACDLDGIQFCQYYADFSMSCDPPDTANPNQYITYFDDLIETVPQTMYLILDLCDTESDYCEYQTLEVSLQ
ncbi:MAG: hypothetical protein WDZ30_12895 [Cellvibrionaceae bacterium]